MTRYDLRGEKNGDQKAFEKLITANLRFVISVAKWLIFLIINDAESPD